MTEPKVQFIQALQKAQQEFPSLAKTKDVGVGNFGYSYLPLEQMLSNKSIRPSNHSVHHCFSQILTSSISSFAISLIYMSHLLIYRLIARPHK